MYLFTYLFFDRPEYSMCKDTGCWFDDRVLIPGLAKSLPSSSLSHQLCITHSLLCSVFREMFLQWKNIRRKAFAHLWNCVRCPTLSGLSHVSYTAWRSDNTDNYLEILLTAVNLSSRCLTFRHSVSCILGQAFHYSPENAFYIFNQQIYFIIWYLLDRASLI